MTKLQNLAKSKSRNAPHRGMALGLLLLLGLARPGLSPAATIWNGPKISVSDVTDPDQMTTKVWLTRGGSQGLYNAKTESGFTHFLSPKDTLWADGTTANYRNLSFTDWNTWSKNLHGGPPGTIGVPAVVHLVSEDIYVDIVFTSWGTFGPYSYDRATPPAANVPPSVTITNPTSGATFVAPASVTIAASATDSDGSVTNVKFFEGTTLLGSVAANPFRTTTNFAAGSHTLLAVATDNGGATSTSAPVTITVIANTLPSVGFITPTNGAIYTAPATLILAANASDADGSVTNVEFFDNSASLGHVSAPPFSLLTPLPVGSHSLRAVAADNSGGTSTTTAVAVTVLAAGTPSAPSFISLSVTNKYPSPPLSVANVPIITNGLDTLRWTGDTRSRFDLLFADHLEAGGLWRLAQPNIVGDPSGTNTLTDPPFLASSAYGPNTNLFYRMNALPSQSPGLAIRLQTVATNLVSPTVLTHAHDGSGRLFIADQIGQIRIVDAAGNLLPTPFLDISNRLASLQSGYDERGLLGLTFHPGYSTNGRFFVYYSAPSPATNYDNVTVLSEFRVSTGNPNQADSTSERILLTINEPEFNHEGADITFGPDGYLYLGPGDGGGAGDQHGATGNGQSLATLLGKILRLDVDSGSPYGIPQDNPFIGTPGARPEIFAYGLRNPWRFSFDRGGTHQGFIADVGQNLWEEIDLLRKGANYGWRILEGSHAFDTTVAGRLAVDVTTLDQPIHEYGHGPVGIAVIGGYVYRGTNYPALNGLYVFGDFSTSFGSPDGQIYYLAQTRPGIWERFPVQLWPANARLGRFLKGFGEDEAGEIYVLSSTALGPSGRTGDVRRLTKP